MRLSAFNPVRILGVYMISNFACGFRIVLLFSLVFFNGCTDQVATEQKAMPTMPPTPVIAAKVLSLELSESKIYTGRLEADQTVQIRPRVSGTIDSVHFEEGGLVSKGDLLFIIDGRSFKSEVKRLNAQLKSARAQIDLAQRDVKRAKSLRQKNAISQEQLDNRNTQLTKAYADADAVNAALEIAKINLDHSQVKAPIAGRVSNAMATKGNYVELGEDVLTGLVSTQIFYAYFDIDEATFSVLKSKSERKINNVVLMNLVGEDGYRHVGYVDFVDNQLNTSTGTIRLRARFENKMDAYTPGMFVRLMLSTGNAQTINLVQEKAIGTDLSTKYVFVVEEAGEWAFRPVQLGARFGSLRAITAGLDGNETVVISGLQRVSPGSVLAPQMQDMASVEEIEKLGAMQSSLSSAPWTATGQ
jgi:multidrug efflux system membrane fusion protein